MKTVLKIVVTALFLSEFSVMAPRAHAQGGVPVWTNRYNGPGNKDDGATAMIVDSSGNVLVTGSSIGSGSSYDYATIKYSKAGVPLWTNRYNGPASSWDFPAALAVDRSGNVFVTGRSATAMYPPFLFDWATVAYSSEGVPLWTNRYNGPGNGNDGTYFVAVDTNSNVLVMGYSYDGTNGNGFTTIKYASAASRHPKPGTPLSTNRYSAWAARPMAMDSNGNVFATGTDGNDYPDYATLKFSSAGVPLWTNFYDGPGHNSDGATALAVDGNGNVFVTGTSWSGNMYTSADYATVAYSGVGVPLWTNRYNGPANGEDQVRAIAVDGSGNVFVTGFVTGNGSGYFATIGYSGAGVPLWTNLYNGPKSNGANATAIAVDNRGNVFVTGKAGGFYATIAYSGSGVPLWTHVYAGSPNGWDATPRAVAVDSDGNVFVTGSDGDGSNNDYATIKYSSIPPSLHFQRLNNRLVLSWTDAAFSLQSAPAIPGTFTNIPNTASPYTNPATASRQYFRLKAN